MTSKKLLNKKQINTLNEWQFTINDYNAFKDITCNQDEIIYCLIDNKIPFTASCHYGHESVYYNPKESNKVYFMHNIGAEVETYGIESLEEFNKDDLVKIETDVDYIKRNKKYHKNDKPDGYYTELDKEEYKK